MFKVVSLFSGAMGLDIGLENSGKFETIAALELESAYCRTIQRNAELGNLANPALEIFQGDIRSIRPDVLMDRLGIQPGDVDVVVGGPPCQTFSTSGRRRSVQDRRGTLLWSFLHFVDVLQPKFFVMENVRGLMSAALRHRPISERPDKGGPPLSEDEQPGSVVHRFVDDLQGQYRMDIFEVNAVNYGAPQIRERVLFVGNRLGKIVSFPAPTHGPVTEASRGGSGGSDQPGLFDGEALQPWSTLGDALRDLKEDSPSVLDFSPRKKSYLRMVPPGGNWRSLPQDIAAESMGRAFHAKGGRSGWWRRLSLDLPSPTIVTMPNHASTALCHPTETRALSLRECARIQGFPDQWHFEGTLQEQYAQVGNAVPVRLGEVAADVLSEALERDAAIGAPVAGEAPPAIRRVYIKAHVRTRRWFKDGRRVLWEDGGPNSSATYGDARTTHKESVIERS